jgi:hypothetical protein
MIVRIFISFGLMTLLVNFTQGFRPLHLPKALKGCHRPAPSSCSSSSSFLLQAKPQVGQRVVAEVDDIGGSFENPKIFFKVSLFLSLSLSLSFSLSRSSLCVSSNPCLFSLSSF